MKKLKQTTLLIIALIFVFGTGFSQKEVKKELKKAPVINGLKTNNTRSEVNFTKSDYSYNVDDISLPDGSEASVTLTVADVATVGSVIVNYDWDTDFFPGEGSFTVTSPNGTTATIGASQSDGSYSVTLMDFRNEDLAGDWTFTVHDSYGDGGHSATNIVFDVNEPATTPVISLNYDAVDFGEAPVGSNNNPYGDVFELSNMGIDTLTVSAITDLSTTDFSTNMVIGDIGLPYGDTVYSFGFTYSPTDVGTDSVAFVIQSNGGNDTIILKGSGYTLPDGVVEVGHELWTGTSLPMEPFYRYSYSQSIYKQSELNTADKRISKIYYHYNGNSTWTEDISVYMKETDSTVLSNYLPWDGFTKVFEGPMTVPDEDGWVEISLTTPFNYSNTKNIAVAFLTHTYAYYSSSDEFFATPTENDTVYMSCELHHDESEWDPTDTTLDATLKSYRPNIRFQFEDLPTGPAVSLSSTSFDYGLIEAEFSASANFIVYNTGIDSLKITGVTLDAPFTCDFTGDIPVGAYDTITVNFEPTVEGDYSTIVHLVSNSTAGTDSISLIGSAYPKGSLFENFEGTSFPPDYWATTGSWTLGTYASSAYEGSKYAYLSSGSDTLISPKIAIESGDILSFYARNSSYSGGSLYLISSTDLETWTYLDTVELTGDYAQFSIDLTSIAGQSYVGFVGDHYVYMDMVYGPILYFPDNDLAALSITGAATPTVQDEVTYNVLVKNLGKIEQTDYLVKLKLGDGTEIGSVTGDTLGFFNEKTYSFNYTFTTVENTSVYGEIVFAADEDVSNNATEELTVNVQPLGSQSVVVGDGDDLNYHAPIDLYYKSSLTEALYYPEEFGLAGTLNNITYYYSIVSSDIPQLPIRVWVGSTDMMDLSDNFIPATDLTLVFDDTLDFPAGDNSLLINFDTPYDYNGGNFVIMVERPLDTVYYSSSDKFYGTSDTEHDNRTRYYQSDSNPNDPNAPTGGTAFDFVPKTQFIFDVSGRGHLEGMVYDENSDSLPNVEIMVDGTNFKTMSDSTGHYAINYIPDGSQTVIANTFGYNENSQTVTIAEFQTTTLDFNMVVKPQVTVSGLVATDDVTKTALENAYVVIEGYAIYADSTDATGAFSFADVWGNETYTINIDAQGYEPYSAELVVTTSNVDLGTITLSEIPYPPIGVTAEVNASDEAVVSWSEPGSLIPYEFRYDDGVVTGQLGFGANPSAVLGAAHFHNAVITEVTWLLTSESAHSEAVIYIFGLDENGVPDVNQLLLESEPQANVDDEWNTYTLPEPIEAPNGFFVGVCTPNIFTAIGIDDGIDAPYEFMLGTQWGIADWTAGNDWLDVGPGGYPNNFTIRAYGFDMGELNFGKSVSARRSINNTDMLIGSVTTPFKAEEPTFNNNVDNSKSFESYNVYRLLEGNEDSTSTWTELATGVTDTSYTDDVSAVADGIYKYAVEAVYTNSLSEPSLSNSLAIGMEAVVTLNITTNAGDAEGASVVMTNQDGDEAHVYTATAPTGGVVVFDAVWKGNYDISVTLNGFISYAVTGVAVSDDMGLDVALVEVIILPFNLEVAVDANTALFSWNNSGSEFADDFESYDDFVMDFDPWTLVDVDQSTTYGFNGIDFPNSGSAMAFIIFNPSMTTPTLADNADIQPHSGDKFAACFASETPPNDDWMITDQFTVASGDIFSFFAKTFVPDYGLERFKVGVSNTGTAPSDFTIITSGDYIEAPSDAWGEYTYDLTAYAGQNIFVGIECVSNDAFIFMVDDVYMGPPMGKNTNSFIEYNVFLDDMGTPVATTTDLNYTFTDLEYEHSYVAGVSAVYESGESDVVTYDFATPVGVNDVIVSNYFTLYPNPAKEKLNISSSYSIDKVEVFNSIGKLVISEDNYTDGLSVSNLTEGIYFVHITSGDNIINKRISITK